MPGDDVSADWVPTARLRWVAREQRAAVDVTIGEETLTGTSVCGRWPVLQQWFAADVPGYMRRDAEGEWRDVPVYEDLAP